MHEHKGFWNGDFDNYELTSNCRGTLQPRSVHNIISPSKEVMSKRPFEKIDMQKEKRHESNNQSLKQMKYNYDHIRKIEEQNMKLRLIKEEMAKYYFNNKYKRAAIKGKPVEKSSHIKIFRKESGIENFSKALTSNNDIQNLPKMEKEDISARFTICENSISHKEANKPDTQECIKKEVSNEDTELFMYFITDVNRKYNTPSSVASDEDKPTYYKHKRDDVHDVLCLVSESSVFGSDRSEQYNCTFCNMKYTYRRCLVNHVKKKHRNTEK